MGRDQEAIGNGLAGQEWGASDQWRIKATVRIVSAGAKLRADVQQGLDPIAAGWSKEGQTYSHQIDVPERQIKPWAGWYFPQRSNRSAGRGTATNCRKSNVFGFQGAVRKCGVEIRTETGIFFRCEASLARKEDTDAAYNL